MFIAERPYTHTKSRRDDMFIPETHNLEEYATLQGRAQSNRMWQNTRLVFYIKYRHNLIECLFLVKVLG